ncbi:MAG TPA: hypothetical protein VGR26_10000 [Acidimicrobiales bacterium]|nr:hypothetical protein [Acidimicrobiales bacterium]
MAAGGDNRGPQEPRGEGARSGGETLPRTGGDALPWVQLGVGLIVLGFLLALLERNRRATQAKEERLSLI